MSKPRPDRQGVLERLAADSSACEVHEPERLPLREHAPTIPGFVIERQLAMDFRRRGKFAESSVLLADSLELLEASRQGAFDPDVEEGYAQALMELGRLAQNQERFDETLSFSSVLRRCWKACWSTTRHA